MNMNVNADDLKIRDRSRVEASLATFLKDHGFSHAQGERFAPHAYDHFRDVNNHVPANAGVLGHFLLKDAAGKALMKEALSIFAGNLPKAPIPVADTPKIFPLEVELVLPEPVDVVMTGVIPDDVYQRLTARVHEAFDDYMASGSHHSNRKPHYIESVLVEIANVCEAHGLSVFVMPCQDYTDMSREFFHKRRSAVAEKKIPDSFELMWQPGGVAPPRKEQVRPPKRNR
ncbi:MAG: hypothetical protein DI585_03335 [Pseudomonas fluorescens]|nr:MAG: hypothetical protein DI585_03335 [Pseudomonas fluorescens]